MQHVSHCERQNISKNSRDRRGAQLYHCADCRRFFTARTGTPFSGHSFPPEVIGLAVRWYLRFRLSYADVVEVLFREQRSTEAAAYPPALAEVLPEIEHLTGKAEQQRIERDHQHLKGRLRVFRGCKTARGAQRFFKLTAFYGTSR